MKADGGRFWLLVAGAPLFCALAIANSAGYRYGVSDLAFYLPAAFQRTDPSLFPRDRALLDVQAHLTLADELIAAAFTAGNAVGLGHEATLYLLHLFSLLVLFAAALGFGRALFRGRWAVTAFLAALTLRHAVGRVGVNTLEGYFHPRVLAFGLGVLAFAMFLKRGTWPALAIALLGTAVHTTTAFWFLVCVGIAGVVSERRDRVPLLALAIVFGTMLVYAVTAGPFAGRLQPMDAEWLAVIAEKDYLFPDQWPPYAWATCLAYVGIVAMGGRARSLAGRLQPRERGLLAGAGALALIFVLLLPALFVRSALVVQLQPSRVFWIFDLLATAAVVWWLGDAPGRRESRAPIVLALVLALLSSARGTYLMAVRFPERSIARVEPPPGAWADAMRFARSTERNSHWLAHPDHTFLYGTSLRVSGRRDVMLERSKDPAIAMYDRGVALRVAERAAAIGDFDGMTEHRARELARVYDIDYLITEIRLALPVAYRNGKFTVYGLQDAR